MITFGPIPSRRLGISLGINNIISPKSCSYNCQYCQVGKTRTPSIIRDTYYSPEHIYKNVVKHLERLDKNEQPDYLTFVSNGEPTLDENLGKSILMLKKTGFPVAVISNASLLFEESVRDDLMIADWVSLKMDAAEKITWRIINRPHPMLDFENHMKSILLFSGKYKGKLNTETMTVKGINDNSTNFTMLAEIIKDINPQKAYLAVPTRPPSEKTIEPPDAEVLNQAWHIYNNKGIDTELLTGFEGTHTGHTGNIYEDILNISAVHPIREDTMIELLNKDNADYHIVESLLKQKLIKSVIFNKKRFYIREYHLQF